MPSLEWTDAFWMGAAIVAYLLIHRFRTGRWIR
jgi:hypothetical protein